MTYTHKLYTFKLLTIVQIDNKKKFKGILKLLLVLHRIKIINKRLRTS